MGTIVFDFETYDPHLTARGSGYVWDEVDIIGMGYSIDGGEINYVQETSEIVKLLTENDTWVAHNISYELGIAKMLGVDFKTKEIYCTLVGCYLQNNLRKSYSLDHLSRVILDKSKNQDRLGQIVIDNKLPVKPNGQEFDYPKKYHQIKMRENRSETDEEYLQTTEVKYLKMATNLAMGNLHLLNVECPEVIEEYCKCDVELTAELHRYCQEKVDDELYQMYSDVNKVLVEMRAKGVRVDLERASEARDILTTYINRSERIISRYMDDGNYRSSYQLAKAFDKLGIDYNLTEKGNPNITARWLEDQDHPLCEAIVNAKKYRKARDEFIENIFKYSNNGTYDEYCERHNSPKYGRIHGEMTLFGARQTGRFSHRNPNLAQIPSRDPVIGPLMRSIFVPDEGETWFSLDFSAQEPRLMVHYAILCAKSKVKYKKEVYQKETGLWKPSSRTSVFDDTSVLVLQQAYLDNPKLDSHTYNMDIINEITGVGITRKATKTIALGLAYSMGTKKLCNSLGLSDTEGYALLDAFNEGSPWLKMLDDYCKYKMSNFKKLRTIGGRITLSDGISYKALNKLIQGSAADQTIAAMLEMYHIYGIIPSIVVHDEVNITGTLEQAHKVKECMETAIKLEIPSNTDIAQGSNWAEAKE